VRKPPHSGAPAPRRRPQFLSLGAFFSKPPHFADLVRIVYVTVSLSFFAPHTSVRLERSCGDARTPLIQVTKTSCLFPLAATGSVTVRVDDSNYKGDDTTALSINVAVLLRIRRRGGDREPLGERPDAPRRAGSSSPSRSRATAPTTIKTSTRRSAATRSARRSSRRRRGEG
jgi:hypothetical protein